jgi:flagellum-specific peptidoglycan hydrolase FlgJ
MALPALRFFNPDPQIPDADLLGFGDGIFEDGTSQYISGDPELTMGLQRPPIGPPQADGTMPGQMQPVDIGGGYQVDPMGNILQNGQPLMQPAQQDLTGVQDPMTGELLQPGQPSNFLPALGAEISNAAQGYPNPLGQGWQEQMGGQQSPAAAGPGAGVTVQADDGTPYTVGQDGSITPGASGIPLQQAMQQMSGGFQPYERQGALPQDMMQRQLGAMGAQQDATLSAMMQGRADEARMVNEFTLQQLAQNEVQRMEEERKIAEQQAKVERFRQEQQALVDMDIETDLISARGPIGALFMVAGAALLGGTGSDAGLRMIERTIDQHVRKQVNQRDTKLGLLAEQIGNAQQAIAFGKSAIYKSLAERTDLLAQKTKNDVYEAQGPALAEQFKQKSLSELQNAEKESMGKLIERMPAPPKPPDPQMMQRYGELRRERDSSIGIAQRAEQQLGLMWSPGQNGQPGHYANADEVLKNGIQGVGNLEQWVPDAVYSTLGGATAEGYQVRGTAEAMAYAQIRQMQPTGPISNADIQAAVKAGALDTEEGLIRGLERIRTNAEQQRAHDERQYGPDIVNAYEQRGGGPTAPAIPTASRAASVEEARRQSAALRQGQGQNTTTESAAAKLDPPTRMAQVAEDIQAMAGQDLPPEGLQILVAQAAHESGNGDSMGAEHGNMFGHKRTGNRRGFEANTTEGEGAQARRTRGEFAAYPTIADGVADHLSLLQRRYPLAWEALQMGDVDAYVARLKDGGYFTGNEELYRNALLRRL